MSHLIDMQHVCYAYKLLYGLSINTGSKYVCVCVLFMRVSLYLVCALTYRGIVWQISAWEGRKCFGEWIVSARR